jgi:peptidoglycan/xylan/chitin deacetylase (PgdA/CDA1 family)
MKARGLGLSLGLLLAVTVAFGADKPTGPEASILCYHIIDSPRDPQTEISHETFHQQMHYLETTGYNVIPLSDLYLYISGNKPSLPKNAVVITVDDGWRSTYTEFYPEMKRRNFPFSVFIYPKIIGMTANALTWPQVREMAKNGVDIQSHSLTHPFLTRRRHATLDDKAYSDWVHDELVGSKKIIESETGKPVEFLAYPYGDYDSRLARIVGQAGYAAALTCEYGRVARGCDLLRLKRVVIDKQMSFAAFRHFLGARPLQLEDPTPVEVFNPDDPVVSARIADYKRLDPNSVGMALLSLGTTPYSYDPRDGSISLVVRDTLQGSVQRAIVWGTEAKSGKRVEAVWSFRLPARPGDLTADPNCEPDGEPRPSDRPAVEPAQPVQPMPSESSVAAPVEPHRSTHGRRK